MTDFQVSLLDAERNEIYSEVFFEDGFSFPDTTVEPFEVTIEDEGQIVRIQLLNTLGVQPVYLSLAEVKVFGEFTDVVVPTGFRRGDTDASGVVDISDPIFNLTFQFVGGIDELPCEDAADVDNSGVVDISDPIYSLTFQFVGGIAPPPAPGPTVCGPDPADPGDDLGCESYPQEKC